MIPLDWNRRLTNPMTTPGPALKASPARPTGCPLTLLLFVLLSCGMSVCLAQDTLFKQVRVITMTDAGELTRADLRVRGGRIDAIDSDLPATGNARVIDGEGLTLMPGLADMHVHYGSEGEGALYLANSITTVRNLWGSARILALGTRAAAGVAAGPNIYTCGPLMDGPNPVWGNRSLMIDSPEQAIGAIEAQRTTGYRAVKLYEGLTPEIYRAAVQAARKRGLQVWTHTPRSMTVDEVLALGVDSLEHFNDVSQAIYPLAEGQEMPGKAARWAGADPALMRAFAERSAASGVWHSPTYTVIADRYRHAADPQAWFARPEIDLLDPGLERWWRQSLDRMTPLNAEMRSAARNQRRLIGLLHEAGAPLLIGTDSPNPFVIPGYAIHDELAAFVAAGISRRHVLEIATREAARFLEEEGE